MLPDPRPYFEELPDPRRETKNKLHSLQDIVMIVLCAVISGVEDWVGMEEFGHEKEAWLKGFLKLPNGIPSHDTLSDVMGRIKPHAFEEAFLAWMQAGLPTLAGEHVALDGKTLRGSRNNGKAVHLMSAFATEKDHGRIETHRYALSMQIEWLEQKAQWAGLQAVGVVESVREIGDKVTTERRYYLCSIKEVQQFAQTVRNHWRIENQQHWVLDVQFGEDANRQTKVDGQWKLYCMVHNIEKLVHHGYAVQ